MNNASSAIRSSTEFQLGEFIRQVTASLRQLHTHPALAWITPQLPVRLIEAGTGESLWLGGTKLDADEATIRSARFTAIEVPADLVLSRSMVLPPLAESDIRDAVALDVRDSNPFDPSDLVWGYRSGPGEAGQVDVTAVLASRRLVNQHIEQVAPELAGSPSLEAWAMAPDGAPVVLKGFGEAARARSAGRGRVLAYGLMTLGLMLAIAAAVTPTVQLHMRTLQAAAAYKALQQRAGPAMAQREALVRGREDLANLREVMADHIDPLVAIDMLTQLIPDDTWLQRVQVQGNRFTLSGQTPNAAALMNTLSSKSGLSEVRAPSPATRVSGSRESFVVEFTVAPTLLQRNAQPPGLPAVAVAAAAAAPAPAPAAQAAASQPASPASAPATAGPVRSQP
ncbi:MAG: Fimbrial assembly family protein [Ramlibacter sp.]|nr:Fimbrial assembly family protein [Ramlibacter sp.]